MIRAAVFCFWVCAMVAKLIPAFEAELEQTALDGQASHVGCFDGHAQT